MKIVVIGGVAAGTKAAAKLKRCDRNAEVIIYTKSKDISYAGCGLPYYVGGSIESSEELIVNTPAKYSALTGVEVKTGMEAVALDSVNKKVSFADGSQAFYDKLIIATGAYPFVPSVKGTEKKGVFTMRTPDDAIALRDYIEENKCRSAVVVGAGFIGLEVAENLQAQGLEVTVADMANQVMPGLFDGEFSSLIRKRLQAEGMRIITSAALKEIVGEEKAQGIVTDVGAFRGDLVVLAIGIRPATQWLEGSGIELEKGAVVTDKFNKTNLDDIYAVGDCALTYNRMTGKGQWSAMGSTANITGRLLAKNLTGEGCEYKGCLGTGVVRLGKGLNAGRTGLTLAAAAAEGIDAESVTVVTDDKAHYYPDASYFVTKLIAEKDSHRLLGIQVMGAGAVDKMVDIASLGISMGAVLEDFESLDFAYAPPFSTAIHPFMQASFVLQNKLCGVYDSMTPAEYASGKGKGYRIIDVNPAPAIPGALWVDLSEVEGELEGISKDEKLLLVCTRGKRAYFLQNRLKAAGYTNTKALEGGLTVNDVKVAFEGGVLPAEEIKRVKGLGCLQDKRYPDVFNVRVITRNGKITSDEHRVIAEAADKFGSGAVAMTTRLTLEIQGVKYDNIAPLIDYLALHNLSTGGTGSLVRPVVSCKGTTCQYGLADTYGLSEKIHEKFYVGYHGVTLPHKFKICVGGCPNNCAKPSLNDIGIVGQKVPVIDYSKCKGCKKCQVEESCPIKIAKVENGKIQVDPTLCNNCGRCAGKCPFGAFEEYRYGFKVYIGGRWGKKVNHGQPLTRIFTSEEEVLEVVENAILLFRDEGISGERFADTVNRLGFSYVNDKLINGKVDKRAVLSKNVKGGATC